MEGTGFVNKRFGISAALATPMDEGGQVVLPTAAAHALWCLGNGCSSVTVFGTTGEGASLGLPARDRVIGALLGAGVPARTGLIGGVASASLHEAVTQAEALLDCDCRGLLVAPPFYFTPATDDGIFAWYAQLFEKLGGRARNVFLYNIPSVTGVTLSVDLVGRLRTAFPEVVEGVKDSSGDIAYSRALLAAHSDLVILVGDERFLAESLQLGAQGSISGLANLIPGTLAAMVETGRHEEAVTRLVEAVLEHPVVPAVKELIARRTGDAGWRNVRAPLLPLAPAAADSLAERVGAAALPEIA